MNKTLSTTKWNRLFIDYDLLQRINDAWNFMDKKPTPKVAIGIEKTITPVVNITMDNIKQFKSAYVGAMITKKSEFVFDGEEYNTKFAKYLIDYFELKDV